MMPQKNQQPTPAPMPENPDKRIPIGPLDC